MMMQLHWISIQRLSHGAGAMVRTALSDPMPFGASSSMFQLPAKHVWLAGWRMKSLLDDGIRSLDDNFASTLFKAPLTRWKRNENELIDASTRFFRAIFNFFCFFFTWTFYLLSHRSTLRHIGTPNQMAFRPLDLHTASMTTNAEWLTK